MAPQVMANAFRPSRLGPEPPSPRRFTVLIRLDSSQRAGLDWIGLDLSSSLFHTTGGAVVLAKGWNERWRMSIPIASAPT